MASPWQDPPTSGVLAGAVELPCDPHAPSRARAVVRETLAGWHMPALVDAVALVATELVTNALRHGRPPIWMRLHRRRERVVLDVGDALPKADSPGVRTPSARDESGRGLVLVRGLSDEFEVDPIPGDGKVASAAWVTDST